MIRLRHPRPFLLALVLIAGPAAAENLLQNPLFNTDLSGWSNYGATPSWTSDDRYDSPTSGAMAIVAGGDIPVGAAQCVTLPGEGDYELGIDFVRAIGSSTAWAWISVGWYSGAACTGSLGFDQDSTEASSGWQRLDHEWTAPGGSASARVAVYSQDTGAAPELHFDNAYFGVPVIFEDGFESADISRWAAAEP